MSIWICLLFLFSFAAQQLLQCTQSSVCPSSTTTQTQKAHVFFTNNKRFFLLCLPICLQRQQIYAVIFRIKSKSVLYSCAYVCVVHVYNSVFFPTFNKFYLASSHVNKNIRTHKKRRSWIKNVIKYWLNESAQ